MLVPKASPALHASYHNPRFPLSVTKTDLVGSSFLTRAISSRKKSSSRFPQFSFAKTDRYGSFSTCQYLIFSYVLKCVTVSVIYARISFFWSSHEISFAHVGTWHSGQRGNLLPTARITSASLFCASFNSKSTSAKLNVPLVFSISDQCAISRNFLIFSSSSIEINTS